MAAIFALPVVLASLLYGIGWRPARAINYGELIQPARPIHGVSLKTPDGKPLDFSRLQKKWTMLYFDSGECGAVCRENLRKMRQVHLAQGENVGRIQRVFVVRRVSAHLREILAENPEMKVLTGSAENINKLAEQFNLPSGAPFESHRVYILDPLVNFIMNYAPTADANGMRRDLNRLLRVSQIG